MTLACLRRVFGPLARATAFLLVGLVSVAAREFEVVVHNVENLFDADGVSLFEDYRPPGYTPGHLARKLEGVSAVLRQYQEGRGPEIVLLVELEADQTPGGGVGDLPTFLARWSDHRAADLLRSGEPLPPEWEGAPSHAWLLKQLADDGMEPYNVAIGRWRLDPTGQVVGHVNGLFSRFPIVASRTHETNGARGILEATLSIDGHPLHVFVNHWKSGASDPETEPIRIGNARVLRKRLDAILRKDPHADIIVAGDFNSQYNQRQRYPRMTRTALNDVLGSQGDELAIRSRGGPALYNLWFELPNERRGSDVFRDEWGTLMQIIITRGLYDFRGVQYADNSFSVGAFPGLNAHADTGRPIRWQFADGGHGFSDHFPIAARFRVVSDGRTDRWKALENPSRTATGPRAAVPAVVSADAVADLASLPAWHEFRTAANLGRHFRVTGEVVGTGPFILRVDGPGTEIVLWVRDPEQRAAYFSRFKPGDRMECIAELGQFRGAWQFVVYFPPDSRG